MGFEEFAENQGGVFAELAIVGAEGGEEVGVDVEFAGDFAVNENGDNDFGFGLKGTSQIAGIGIDVIDDDGFAGGSSGTTDALIERNARVRSHGALKGTEDEDIVVGFFLEHVEADPVVAGEFFMKKSDDALHKSVGGGGSHRKRVESGNQVGRFRGCGSHKNSRPQIELESNPVASCRCGGIAMAEEAVFRRGGFGQAGGGEGIPGGRIDSVKSGL